MRSSPPSSTTSSSATTRASPRPRRHDRRRDVRVPVRASKRKGIDHNVLNAKEHEREGEIIKDAGQPGAVTIATNMAGRGVDIKLGEGVLDLGGLYVLGTERHEAAPHRQPAPRPLGQAGRPRRDALYLSGQDDPCASSPATGSTTS